MSAGKKSIAEKNLFYWKVCNVLSKILCCICKYFIMYDVQSHNIIRRSKNDLESGCLSQADNCSNNCSKIKTYTVLNTLSEDCNFDVFGLRYCKRLS